MYYPVMNRYSLRGTIQELCKNMRIGSGSETKSH